MALLIKSQDVRTLDRNTLMDYLFNYIAFKKTRIAFNKTKSEKLSEVERQKNMKYNLLDSRFEKFTQQQLTGVQIRANSFMAKFRKWVVSHWPEKYFLYVLWTFFIVLFFIVLFFSFEKNFGQRMSVAVPAAVFGGAVAYWCRHLLQAIVEILISIIGFMVKFTAVILDMIITTLKGINKRNIRKVFKYSDIKEKITNEYDGVKNEIEIWNKDYYDNVSNNEYILSEYIPEKVDTVGYLQYIYDQLNIGAADNWKEAVNILNDQIRHAETMGQLQNLSQQLEKMTKTVEIVGEDITNQISALDSNINSSFERINLRIDGLFEGYGMFW